MRNHSIQLLLVCLTLLVVNVFGATYYVDQNCANPTPPYSDWSIAATNIQDAIDASTNGDLVLVTNGVYQYGGRVMTTDLTNRVALYRPITVQSVNGPWLTIIQGAGATNGISAVRCAWLTNGASLVGFTLQGGLLAPVVTPPICKAVAGCFVRHQTLLCLIVSSDPTKPRVMGRQISGVTKKLSSGGNISTSSAYAASDSALLYSCTVVSNNAIGVNGGNNTNCIIYYNSPGNSIVGNFAYCCITPKPSSGPSNNASAPLLYTDGIRLTWNSPCRTAGTNLVSGQDIFGNAWMNPPSIGCAEWQPAPVLGSPSIQLTNSPVGFSVGNVSILGQPPFSFYWLKDGVQLQDGGHFSFTQSSNLVATGVNSSDAGYYQLVASNAFGVATSAVARLVVHYVDVASTNRVSPYTNWTFAAANIQDAIDASLAGEIVLVTNGLYNVGGKSMDATITNRVSITKAIIVQSVNGPGVTIIQGAIDPATTNGLAAIRCAWLTNNACLSGFTLQGGATRQGTNSVPPATKGGGVWGSSTSAMVYNCIIATNFSSYGGGGAYVVTLDHCTVIGNHCALMNSGSDGGGASACNLKYCFILSNSDHLGSGGGTANCNATNCVYVNNYAFSYGGAVSYGRLENCTVYSNNFTTVSSPYGAAVYGATLDNCLIWGNFLKPGTPYSNYASCTMTYCCSDPLPAGIGNIDVNPQLLNDGYHLSQTSPCIGAGNYSTLFGTDIDGQAWKNAPSIGCDEWQAAPVISGQNSLLVGFPAHGLTLGCIVAGQSPFNYFWAKNGVGISNDGHHSNADTANLTVNNLGPDDAGLYQLVVSNAYGLATSQVSQVVIHAVDAGGSNPVPPYSTWATAATRIQDAIDSAAAGEIVLVTNGLYATGGKVVSGNLTNRVAIDKALIVISVNGYSATTIQGVRDPVSTNGPAALRCAYLVDGAVLNGFTLQNGATRNSGDAQSQSGGGVYCLSSNGMVYNCELTNNAAIYGGGIANGTLNNSLVLGNLANLYGGGAYFATLNNCFVDDNHIKSSSFEAGAGTYDGLTRNSIVMFNFDDYPFNNSSEDDFGAALFAAPKYSYCYVPPLSVSLNGIGNITASGSTFVNQFHISIFSTCRGKGSALYASGTDLDGEPWLSPPSIGCDEVIVSNLTGPLSGYFTVNAGLVPYPRQLVFLRGSVAGKLSYANWSFGDGSGTTNAGVSAFHTWTNVGDYTVTLTVFNTDNPAGVIISSNLHVFAYNSPQLSAAKVLTNGFSFQMSSQPYANYTVQYTTNLIPPVTWSNLPNTYSSFSSSIQILDPNTNAASRFYRVLAQ